MTYDTDKLIPFISENKLLILDRDFDELYSTALKLYGIAAQLLTQFLIDCNVNPLDFVTYLAEDMFYKVVLPEKFKNLKIPYNVKTISDWRFGRCYGLESIDLNNADCIGENAFSWSDIELINLENVKYILEGAFSNCLGLEQINLKNAIQVGESAFYGCRNLKTVYAPKDLDLSIADLPVDCNIIRV